MKLRSVCFGIVFSALITGCSTTQESHLLYPAMAYGEVSLLNEIQSDGEKQLYIKLYKTPKHNIACSGETENICRFQYTLSVASFDEHPEVNVYQLEPDFIENISWGTTDEIDTAVLHFSGSSSNEPGAPVRQYRAVVTLDQLKVESL